MSIKSLGKPYHLDLIEAISPWPDWVEKDNCIGVTERSLELYFFTLEKNEANIEQCLKFSNVKVVPRWWQNKVCPSIYSASLTKDSCLKVNPHEDRWSYNLKTDIEPFPAPLAQQTFSVMCALIWANLRVPKFRCVEAASCWSPLPVAMHHMHSGGKERK